MKLYPIVEGHGEVAAVPVLLRRLLWDHAQCYGMGVGTPIRQTSSQFRRETEVQRMVRLALLQPDCAAVLLLFDGEDDCPFELAATVRGWAQAAAGQTPCEVVIAYREYETWFLASVESLRGRWGIADDAAAPDNPEAKRDAKGALEEFLPYKRGYSPSDAVYWQHGHSTERDFVYVTTASLTHEQLQQLGDEVGPDRSLLVLCTAFRAKPDAYPNLTVKKIPKQVLSRCEWGHDDYSLQVENLPKEPPKPGQQALFDGDGP